MTTSPQTAPVIEPAFEGCDRCIVFSANASYIPLTSVAVRSIAEHCCPNEVYDIIILHRGADDALRDRLSGMLADYSNISIRFYDMDAFVRSTYFYVDNHPTITAETYYRLYIPWLLSERYRSSLYIDGDMLITQNINKIFDYQLDGYLIAGVRDYWGICNCYIPGDPRREYRESIGLTDINNYIIAGTILFNLKAFRQKYTLEQVQKLIQAKKWMQHDQDVINILAQGAILHIPPDWGMMTDYGNWRYLPQFMLDDLAAVPEIPTIIHYGGFRKPYSYAHTTHDMLFWETAARTPFFAELLAKISVPHYKYHVVRELDRLNHGGLAVDGAEICYNDIPVGRCVGEVIFRVIQIRGNRLYLEGWCGQYDLRRDDPLKVRMRIDGTLFEPTHQCREDIQHQKRRIFYAYGQMFRFDMDLSAFTEKLYHLEIQVCFQGVWHTCTDIQFGKFCTLGDQLENAYYYAENWAVNLQQGMLTLSRCSWREHLQLESHLCKEILKTGGLPGKKAVVVRPLAHLLKRLYHKPIWMVSDRISKADDNGEVFFRYLAEHHKRELLPVFVIGRDCPDYKRLKQYGLVVPAYSYRHKVLLLCAQFSIVAQTDDTFRTPFYERHEYYRDMLGDVRGIFLQHGITKDDLTSWLARRFQHFSGFVVSAWPEYQSILEGEYYYTPDELWLTGMPRFDAMEDRSEKIVTVMPTWRTYLATEQNHDTGIWTLIPYFSESEYVSFYRNLMQHPRLRQKAQELGYRIRFKCHPSFLKQEAEFGFDDQVELVPDSMTYQEIYASSSLVVTDYSSVGFDFAYLRKPIIYAQFDSDTFFSGKHIYDKGYFDYERDGFGEVEHDLEGTVDRMISYMENSCELKDVYRQRIDAFFAFNDRNNCQRVYEKIKDLD